jgi:iron complex outermembrane recepter protein
MQMRIAILLAAAVVAQGVCPVFAQQDQTATPQQDQGTLGEVIVTAEKRAENVQRVPVSVSAVTLSQLDAMHIQSPTDLTQAIPGYSIWNFGGNPHDYIRGIGSSTNVGQESPVGIYVDGVYYEHPSISDVELNNVTQVEVLKGPQGTLFGRNAVGGVVSYTTRNPTQTPSVDVSVGQANYDTTDGNIYATSGITDELATNIAIAVHDQRDGWGTNLYTRQALHTSSNYSARNKWVLTPNDSLKFTLSVDYNREEPASAGVAASRGVYPFINTGPFHTGGFYDSYLPVQPLFQMISQGVSLRVQDDFSWASFVSITAVRRDVEYRNFPYEFTPPFLPATPAVGQVPSNKLSSYQEDSIRAFTQEFQLLSAPSSFVKWVAGTYLLFSDDGYDLRNQDTLSGPIGAVNNFSTSSVETVSTSLFGQATIPVAKHTQVTGGLRYTDDYEAVKGYAEVNTIANPDVYTLLPSTTEASNPEPSGTWSKATYKASVEQDVSHDIFAYASVSTGFESASYNIGGTAGTAPLQPTTIVAYEIGMKGDFLKNRLRVNTAIYDYDLSNMVVSQVVNSSTLQTNAAKGKIDGIDLDVAAAVTNELTLTASAAYSDPRYSSYPDGENFVPNSNGSNWKVVSADDTGEQLQFTEKLAATVTADYRIATGIGDFSLAGSANYHSGIHFDTQNLNDQPPYTLVGGSVRWVSPSGRFDQTLWVKNLTNRHIGDLYPNNTLMLYSVEAPRTFGFSVGFHWE